jgi:hypothetical protein
VMFRVPENRAVMRGVGLPWRKVKSSVAPVMRTRCKHTLAAVCVDMVAPWIPKAGS